MTDYLIGDLCGNQHPRGPLGWRCILSLSQCGRESIITKLFDQYGMHHRFNEYAMMEFREWVPLGQKATFSLWVIYYLRIGFIDNIIHKTSFLKNPNLFSS